MKAAFYSGQTGLIAHQQAMDVIGNNLANVNTNGYQSQGVSFQTALNNQMYANIDTDPLTGFGVKSVSTGLHLGTNALRATDIPLDFAIGGDGFFAIENGDKIQYTRDGQFALSVDGDEAELTTWDGFRVLSADGDPITLEKPKDSDTFDYAKLKEEIGVFTFVHPSALDPVSSNRYEETTLSGEAEEVENGYERVLQGFVENSGTSVSDEMANMIAIQRGFQISAKVLQTADENEQTINNLRK